MAECTRVHRLDANAVRREVANNLVDDPLVVGPPDLDLPGEPAGVGLGIGLLGRRPELLNQSAHKSRWTTSVGTGSATLRCKERHAERETLRSPGGSLGTRKDYIIGLA